MSFGGLLEAALAGTQRYAPPAFLPDLEGTASERRLLRGASYAGMRRLAGRPVERLETYLALEPSRPETLLEVPRAAAAYLMEIMTDRPELLREWLTLAASRMMRIPHVCLPDLLGFGLAEPDQDLRDLIQQVGGERLAWLASLNPEWRFAAPFDPEQQFALGARDERARALRTIRRLDAARARQLLADTWSAERGDARAVLLEVLADGLSADDEPLLQQAMSDSRKEVRETALHFIRRIPRSAFSQRWIERARQVVAFKTGFRRPRVEVHEPGEPEPAWVADGLDPRPPKGAGRTAWLLQQTVALTPPSIWPRDSLDAIQHSDWARPMLAGLGQAAQAYADADWCEDLLVAWAVASERKEQLPLSASGLLSTLDPARAERALLRLFELGGPGLAGVAGAAQHAWSEDFSRSVIRSIPRLVGKWEYAVITLLRDAQLRLDPRVVPEAERLLESQADSAWVRPSLMRLVQTLEYRRDMHAGFLAGSE